MQKRLTAVLAVLIGVWMGSVFMPSASAQVQCVSTNECGGGSSSLVAGTTAITGTVADGDVLFVLSGKLAVATTAFNYSSNTLFVPDLSIANRTGNRVAFYGASGMSDDSGFGYNASTDILTVANVTVATNLKNTALTAGRVTFAGTNGLLTDDSDMTFSGGDTLTVTKLSAPTSITSAGTVTVQSGTASTSNPGIILGAQGYGLSGFSSGTDGLLYGNGTTFWLFLNQTKLELTSAQTVGWTSSVNNATSGLDTNLSRVSAGVVGVGTGAAGSVAGTLQVSILTSNTVNVSGILAMSDGSGINIGSTQTTANPSIAYNTSQTIAAGFLNTGTVGNYWLLAERADFAFNFAHAQQTDPTLFIHSHNQSTTQWISLTHDATNGVLDVGTGVVSIPDGLTSAGTITSTRTTDIGWSVVVGANTACNTTCTNACVFGEDTSVVGTVVGCTDATADLCVCAGAN